MKVLFDTSVLVASLIETHTFHEPAFNWLEKVRDKSHAGVISAHFAGYGYPSVTDIERISIRKHLDFINHNQPLISQDVVPGAGIVPMFRSLHKSLLNRIEMNVIQLLLKKLSIFDSRRMIALLPDSVLAYYETQPTMKPNETQPRSQTPVWERELKSWLNWPRLPR